MYHPVFDGMKIPSWRGEDPPEAPVVQADTLERMLSNDYDYEAFTAGYVIADQDGTFEQKMPRLSKEALETIRAWGGDVFMHAAFIDLDRVPHEPWATATDARSAVSALVKVLPDAVIYATSRGLRVVFRLRRIVRTNDWTAIAICAIEHVRKAVTASGIVGLELDETCKEWTRLARLPKIKRDGKSTASSCFIHMPDPWPAWYPGHDDIKSAAERVDARTEDLVSANKEEQPSTKPEVDDEFFLWFRRITKYDCPDGFATQFKAILEGKPFYQPGQRDSETMSVVGMIVKMYAVRNNAPPTPSQVYGLLFDSVAGSTGTPPHEALAATWGQIIRMVAREHAKAEERVSEAKSQIEAARSANPMILYTNKTRYVWHPDLSSYGEATTNDQTLMADMMREHPHLVLGEKGKIKPLHHILREYGVRISTVRRVLGMRGSRLVVEDGSAYKILEEGFGTLRAVDPVNHLDVERYFEAIQQGAGKEDFDRMMDWICTCTQFEHATTAIFLQGPPGCGKSMLVEALTRIFGAKADFQKVMGRFNASLLNTGLIHLDEGSDDADGHDSGASAANKFRTIVGGGSLAIEMKGVDPIDVVGNYRVIITANNRNPLPVSNTHTLDDFNAIAQRVLYVHLGNEPKQWLEQNDGKKITGDWVDRVDPETGTRRSGKLVEHIAWIIKNRTPASYAGEGGRFIVPAKIRPWHAKALLQGILRDVLDAAGKAATMEQYDKTARIIDGQVHINDAGFDGLILKLVGAKHEAIDVRRAIREALCDGTPRRLPTSGGKASYIFYPMPTDLILAVAETDRPEIFIEEAQIYNQLKKELGRT